MSNKLLGIFPVDVFPFRLPVGTVRSPVYNILIKQDPTPVKRFNDIILSALYIPVLIGIFNSEDHLSAVFAGKQVIVQCSPYAADVKRTRRTGCKPYPYFLIVHKLFL
jgi:hypothetical protein